MPGLPERPDLPELPGATFCATLVDEWARAGVTDAVVCPGSRSTPMALALAGDDRIRVHVQVDERSAGFMALGLGLATGRPAVVLTTSGTAAVELHPAVVEAHQARVPLIACTADRPPELQDVGAPQTIDQVHLFGSAVRWFCDPGVPDDAARRSWRSLGARVVLAAAGAPPGPVHVNLPFRDPLVGRSGPLPEGRADGSGWRSLSSDDRAPTSSWAPGSQGEVEALVDRLSGRRGVIVAGEGVGSAASVLALGALLGWPVLADPRSGCRAPDAVVVAHADAILRASGTDLVPEVVLGLGKPHASKVLGQWVASHGPDVVLIDRCATWADADHLASVVVEAEPAAVCEALAKHLEATGLDATSGSGTETAPDDLDGWLASWQGAERSAATIISEVLAARLDPTEPAVAREVVAAIPDGGTLVVSSSMPIRDVEWYSAPRTGLRVLANRGANGIDGVVSTALGVALAGGPVVALVGDLAFLHDSNALLGAAARGVDLTVVVVDNDGGGIFSFLPQRELLEPERFEQLFGTPHGADLAVLASAHGVATSVALTQAELAQELALALGAGGVRVVLVRTDRQANAELHRELHERISSSMG